VVDAVAGLDPSDPRVGAVGEIVSWVASGASLASVPAANGRVIPFPGAAIYTEVRAAAQTAVVADELGSAVRTMSYPAVNEGNPEDAHGSCDGPDALCLRAPPPAGRVTGAPVPRGLLAVSRDYFADAATGTPHTRREVLLGALDTAIATLTARFGTADRSR